MSRIRTCLYHALFDHLIAAAEILDLRWSNHLEQNLHVLADNKFLDLEDMIHGFAHEHVMVELQSGFGNEARSFIRINEVVRSMLPITRKRINLNTCPDPDYGPVITCAVELADMG
jgi:hypothetical protein